jgi:hypothetical protein
VSGLLTRCDGPECPSCGCQDVRIIKEPKASNGQVSWWGSGQARCNHCRRVFSFRAVPTAQNQEPQTAEEIASEMMLTPKMPAVQLAATIQAAEVERRVVVVPKCPDCGGETKVASTRKAFRWHKCVRCGKTMKTQRNVTGL